jgi:hypothetical protein
MVVMMTAAMVVMMVRPGSKHRACKHEQQQCRCENLFHEKHPSTTWWYGCQFLLTPYPKRKEESNDRRKCASAHFIQ